MKTGNPQPLEVDKLQRIQDSIELFCGAIASGADEEAELEVESKDKKMSVKVNIYDALEKLLARRRELKNVQNSDND